MDDEFAAIGFQLSRTADGDALELTLSLESGIDVSICLPDWDDEYHGDLMWFAENAEEIITAGLEKLGMTREEDAQ